MEVEVVARIIIIKKKRGRARYCTLPVGA